MTATRLSTGDLGPGQMLGRYKLTREIGRGSMGLVYLAEDTRLGEPICIKVMNPALMRNHEALERFSREMVLARRVIHPGVCRMFELHEEAGLRFLTMEYVEGTCLRDLLGADRPLLPVDVAASIGAGVADALAAAHDVGVIHRDLKPRNIMVRADGTPVLLDFGIATALDVTTNLTLPGVALGTKHYIAPEVWAGRSATPRSDQYAVGVIVFNCLTGKMPFRAAKEMSLFEEMRKGPPPAPSAVRPEVPKALDAVVLRALAFSPDDRFPDVRTLGRALLEAAGLLAPHSADAPATVIKKITLPAIEVTKVGERTGSFSALQDDTGRASVDEADPVSRSGPSKTGASKTGASTTGASTTGPSGTGPSQTGPSSVALTLPSEPANSAVSDPHALPVTRVLLSGPNVHEPTLEHAPARPFDGGATQVLPAPAAGPSAPSMPPLMMPATTVSLPEPAATVAEDDDSLVVPGMMSRTTKRAAAAGALSAVVAVLAFALWPRGETPVATGLARDAGVAVATPPNDPPPVPTGAATPDAGARAAMSDAGLTASSAVAPPPAPPPATPVAAPPVAAPPVAAPPVAAPPDDTPAADEPTPRDAPTRATRRGTDRAQSRAERAATTDERARLDAAMKEKGVLAGDDAELDRLRAQATAAAGQRRYDDAQQAIGAARARLERVQIDKMFVKAKLARFNTRYDASTNDDARARANALAQDALSALSAGRFDDANRALNAAFAALR